MHQGVSVMVSKASKLRDRAGNWETRSKQAAAKGDFDRAGRLRTKALQLMADAQRVEAGERTTIWKSSRSRGASVYFSEYRLEMIRSAFDIGNCSFDNSEDEDEKYDAAEKITAKVEKALGYI